MGVSTVAAAAATTTEAADAAELGGAGVGVGAEMGMAAAVGVSFADAVGVLSNTSMGEGMTSMASPDWRLDCVRCLSDKPEPRLDTAGEGGAGRVEVGEGEGGLESVNDEMGVLNADVEGDDDWAGEGDKLAGWIQGEWHLVGSGQDDGGVANADDDDDVDGCNSGGMIIGIGFVGNVGERAVNEEISDLISAGWLSLTRYPSVVRVRVSRWSDPSFALAAFIGGGGKRVPLEFR